MTRQCWACLFLLHWQMLPQQAFSRGNAWVSSWCTAAPCLPAGCTWMLRWTPSHICTTRRSSLHPRAPMATPQWAAAGPGDAARTSTCRLGSTQGTACMFPLLASRCRAASRQASLGPLRRRPIHIAGIQGAQKAAWQRYHGQRRRFALAHPHGEAGAHLCESCRLVRFWYTTPAATAAGACTSKNGGTPIQCASLCPLALWSSANAAGPFWETSLTQASQGCAMQILAPRTPARASPGSTSVAGRPGASQLPLADRLSVMPCKAVAEAKRTLCAEDLTWSR